MRWVTVCRYTVLNQPPRQTQPPTLSRTGNKYWPAKVQWYSVARSKGRHPSFHLWIKRVGGRSDPSLTHATPEYLRDYLRDDKHAQTTLCTSVQQRALETSNVINRVTILFQQWFSRTFPRPKNEFPWPIGTSYFFEINYTIYDCLPE